MQKILIVEDDEKLRNELKKFLENNGYAALALCDFGNPLQDILEKNADLILLDINLPCSDGEYLCREIRKTSDVPIIMVTSRDNEIDELMSLGCGADQYVTKPFNIRILLAKIAGLLRRSQKPDADAEKMDCGNFVLRLSQSAVEKDGRIAELTKNEFKILRFLAKNRGKIVAREEIMDCLWESESFIDDNTLTVNVTRLRGKLDGLGLQDVIETKRGQGYLLK